MPRLLFIFTSLNGFLAVALGAFGAHRLQPVLEARQAVSTWQTAVHYHLAHALAGLVLLAWASTQQAPLKLLMRISSCWLLGSLLFAGSLYGLALGGPRWLGPITPLGGLAFLIGWALVAFVRPVPPSAPANPR